MSSSLFDRTIQSLGSSIALRDVRHNITLSNIANAETPGFKAKKVDFEEALSRALEQETANLKGNDLQNSSLSSIEKVKADIYEDPDGNVSNDGNSVDLETELSNLAKNSILYKAAVQLMNKQMAQLKYSIKEGRS